MLRIETAGGHIVQSNGLLTKYDKIEDVEELRVLKHLINDL